MTECLFRSFWHTNLVGKVHTIKDFKMGILSDHCDAQRKIVGMENEQIFVFKHTEICKHLRAELIGHKCMNQCVQWNTQIFASFLPEFLERLLSKERCVFVFIESFSH